MERVKKEKKPKLTESAETKVAIPLIGIDYRAVVDGVQARVRSIQRYKNDSNLPVEAVYVFPLPDEASVTGCRMVIGNRKVQAEIKKREEAKKEYQEAIDAGHHGALMEQERPNIFTMNVGGIEPGEDISVEIDYVQRVIWQQGGGRFRIPLVVAPRFIPGMPTGKSAGGWSPDTDIVPDASRITPVVAEEGVDYNAKIKISFAPGFKCLISSPSHAASVRGKMVNKDQTIEIKTGEVRTDRDFILVYESMSKVAETAIHCGKFAGEDFSILSIFPPAQKNAVPSDIIFLLDISGSMAGAKLAGLKTLAKKVLVKMKDQKAGHRVSIIAFEDNPHLLYPMGEITDNAIDQIDKLNDMGCTYLGKALTFAHGQFGRESNRPKIIFVVSDGQTNDTAFAGSGARIICSGIDTAVDDATLKSLAQATGGTCLWFYPGEDFERAANNIVGTLSGPILQNIKVESGGEAVGVQDVFFGMPATIAVCHTGKSLPNKIKISGVNAQGKSEIWEVETKKAMECDFAGQIWAREFLRENPDPDKQIPASLKYGVICSHTAFVAVAEKKVPGQKPVRVEIPVNLPHGWDYGKIFGNLGRGVFGSLNLRSAKLGTRIGSGLAGAGNFKGFAPPVFARSFGGDRLFNLSDVDLAIIDVSEDPLAKTQASQKGCFSLDAADLGDRVIGILIAANDGHLEEAQKTLDALRLIQKDVQKWSEEKKARTKYFLIRLSMYGLQVKISLFHILDNDAKEDGAISKGWYALIKKEIGSPFDAITLPFSSADDSVKYINWKLGKEPRPVNAPWSMVP